MSVRVEIPVSLVEYSGAPSSFRVSAKTVGELLTALENDHPDVFQSICDETGRLRPHIHIFVNMKFVPAHEALGLAFRVQRGDLVSIMTAVSGG